MLTKKNFLFLSLCLPFLNMHAMKHADKIALLFNVYRAKSSSRLYRVIHAGDFTHNDQTIPVVVYEEIRKKPQYHRYESFEKSYFHPPFANTNMVTEETFIKNMVFFDTNCVIK